MVFWRTLWIKHAGAQLEAAAASTIITAACVLQNTRFFCIFFYLFCSPRVFVPPFQCLFQKQWHPEDSCVRQHDRFWRGKSDCHWFSVSYTLSATSSWPLGVTYPIRGRRGLPEVAALVHCGASSPSHTCRVSGLNRKVADCLCVCPQLLSQPPSVISSAAAKKNFFLIISSLLDWEQRSETGRGAESGEFCAAQSKGLN